MIPCQGRTGLLFADKFPSWRKTMRQSDAARTSDCRQSTIVLSTEEALNVDQIRLLRASTEDGIGFATYFALPCSLPRKLAGKQETELLTIRG